MIETYSSDVVVLSVQHFVPKCMQLIDVVVILEWEKIGPLIAFWPLRVKSVLIVERLNNVSHIVDEKSESIWFGITLITWVESVLDVVIDVGVQVVITLLAWEPSDDVIESDSQVSWFIWVFEVWRVPTWNPYIVSKMEVRLPTATVVLDVVGKGCALHKTMIFFVGDQFWIWSDKDSQEIVGGSQRFRAILLEQSLSNVGNYMRNQNC